VALLLATSCRIPEACQAAKSGEWPRIWSSNFMLGKGLAGSTVGIYGMGRIGMNVARKLSTFKPKAIVYNSRRMKPELDGQFAFVSFDELLRHSDFLVITVSANKENAGVFDAEAFKRMKHDAILVNISRGSIVRTNDLYEALRDHQIFAAGLDVTDPEPLPKEHPLFSLNNCVITPHIGSANPTARRQMFELAQSNAIAILQGEDTEMPSPLT